MASGSEIRDYVDFDYAENLDKPLTWLLFIVFGWPISWKANMQSVVILLTTESRVYYHDRRC